MMLPSNGAPDRTALHPRPPPPRSGGASPHRLQLELVFRCESANPPRQRVSRRSLVRVRGATRGHMLRLSQQTHLVTVQTRSRRRRTQVGSWPLLRIDHRHVDGATKLIEPRQSSPRPYPTAPRGGRGTSRGTP